MSSSTNTYSTLKPIYKESYGSKELEIRKVTKEEFEKNSLNSEQSLRDRELEERIKRIK